MMSSTLSYQVVARHLLYAGRIQDAMCTCLKEIEPRNAGSASPKNVQNVIVAREPTSKEFFQASIEYCEKIEGKYFSSSWSKIVFDGNIYIPFIHSILKSHFRYCRTDTTFQFTLRIFKGMGSWQCRFAKEKI